MCFINFFNYTQFCKSIGAYAFSNCSLFTFVIIPDLVISIGKYAFEGCCDITFKLSKNSKLDLQLCGCKNNSKFTSDLFNMVVKKYIELYNNRLTKPDLNNLTHEKLKQINKIYLYMKIYLQVNKTN